MGSLIGSLVLVLWAAITWLPGQGPWFVHTFILFTLGAVIFAAALGRAHAEPAERTGWLLFALGMAINIGGNVLWQILRAHVETGPFLRYLPLATNPLAGAVLAAGVWKWPWRGREGHGSLFFLGSLVFCASLLLLPWMRGVWSPVRTSASSFPVLAATYSLRFALVGGLTAYLAAEDPARLRGPLGWVLLNSCLLFLQMAVFAPAFSRFALAAHSPWLLLTPVTTGMMLMATLVRHPVEAPAGGRPLPRHFAAFLLYTPFLAATTLIVVTCIGGNPPGPWVLVVFLLMTAALVLRQFLLQEQVTAAYRDMEERVRARTHDLEKMQDVVLLNERLNAVVVLGAGLVHDLNKGLGSILSAAEVLQMELERRMKVSGFAVEAIIQAVERSAVLSSRVMDFSRRLQEEGEVRDLRRELAALEGLLKLLIPCGMHLLLQPGQEPAPVRIHTEDLKQILVNLVANARDAMPSGGTIRVAVGKEAQTGETYLDVEDCGTGIAKEHLAKLFEPFFTTKAPGSASGLGLASVKILLEKVQGRVEVSSAMGAGTRFRLLFPPPAAVQV